MAARSEKSHSGRFSPITATRSPTLTPSDTSPRHVYRTFSQIFRPGNVSPDPQVFVSQGHFFRMPRYPVQKHFRHCAIFLFYCFVVQIKILPKGVLKTGVPLSPSLLPLISLIALHRSLLGHSQIEFLHIFVLLQFFRRAFQHNAPCLHDERMVGDA